MQSSKNISTFNSNKTLNAKLKFVRKISAIIIEQITQKIITAQENATNEYALLNLNFIRNEDSLRKNCKARFANMIKKPTILSPSTLNLDYFNVRGYFKLYNFFSNSNHA